MIPSVEFLDGKRDTSAEHAQLLFEFLLRKYHGVRFDLIVTLDDFALQFAFAHRQQLSPDAPIVFAGVNNYRPEMLVGQPKVTGVVEAFDFTRSFELLRKLRPKSRTIHLICDAAQGNEDTLAVFFRSAVASGLDMEFHQIRDWTAENLPQRLAALPPGDAAFVIGIARDFSGRVISEDANFIHEIASRSAVPIFMVNQPVLPVSLGYGWEQGLWLGVGGAMLSSTRHGETAGELACRILHGEDAAAIPVLTTSPTRVAFSYPQLVRHGIDLSLLPPDAEVYNRSYNFFQLYRARILITLGVILLLAAAVVVLIASNLRRHRAELALRRSNERLQLLMTAIEQATELIALLNHDGTAFYANAALSRVLPPEKSSQLPNTTALWRDSGGHMQPFAAVVRATSEKGSWQEQISLINNQGTATILQLIVTPIQPAPGESTRYLLIAQDVTQETRLEEQVRLSQKMDAIGTLASGIAHDLNNILAPMLMVPGLLKDKLPAESDQEILALVQQGAQRGANIVKQLLIFSRGLGSERLALQPRHLLKEMMTLMQETFPREIDLHFHAPATLNVLHADPTQIHQVLLNLCVNARDAMPEGGRLSLTAANRLLVAGDPALRRDTSPGAFVLLEVRDSGHGIPPEIKHRIFDPFFTTKPLGKGTGLGLATVLGIVQGHGGFIDVTSEAGQGTTFRVYLPAASDSALPDTPAVADRPPPRPSRTILLVDDERNVRESFRLVLETHGHRILLAVNGRDALTQFVMHQRDISLVLTDVMMPVMNGVALARALRALAPHLPIIAMSGMSEVTQQAELTALGVVELVAKPCSEAALLGAIARAGGQKS